VRRPETASRAGMMLLIMAANPPERRLRPAAALRENPQGTAQGMLRAAEGILRAAEGIRTAPLREFAPRRRADLDRRRSIIHSENMACCGDIRDMAMRTKQARLSRALLHLNTDEPPPSGDRARRRNALRWSALRVLMFAITVMQRGTPSTAGGPLLTALRGRAGVTIWWLGNLVGATRPSGGIGWLYKWRKSSRQEYYGNYYQLPIFTGGIHIRNRIPPWVSVKGRQTVSRPGPIPRL
jgi:hypothetical protein